MATVLKAEDKLAFQKVIEEMKVEELGDLESEDEILKAAVNLTLNLTKDHLKVRGC